MAAYEVTCTGCGETFAAGSPRARWCSDRCKKWNQRHPNRHTNEREPEAEEAESTGLAVTVREELDEAGRLNTFYGRLAVQLASRLEKPDETGVSSLSKELRLVMEAALTGVKPAVEPEDGEDEDEVGRARRQREEMAELARRSAEG